jgi:hypothetical protein
MSDNGKPKFRPPFYLCARLKSGPVCWRFFNGVKSALDPRSDLRNHSPDGFNWGYGGSGPAQLSLALTADVLLNPWFAERTYQALKQRVISRIDLPVFRISERTLRYILAGIIMREFPKTKRVLFRYEPEYFGFH